MAKVELSELSTEELQAKLKAGKTIQRTVIGIFAIIILAWIILGYWLTNIPVFISTVAVAVGTTVSVSVAPREIAAELQKRNQDTSG